MKEKKDCKIVQDLLPNYIDKLTDGDYLYLVWQEKVYIYTYQQTKIVKANDWSPIYSGEESLLTLTSCDPIGTSWNRIIVTGVLTDVAWAENFDFPACKNHPEQREIWPRLGQGKDMETRRLKFIP